MKDQKQQFISDKIRELMHTGKYSQNECIAIAYSMAKENHLMQQGGQTNLVDNTVLNKASNINFTNDFAKSGYFVNESDWDREHNQRMAQEQYMAQNNNSNNIVDITSDGVYTSRKVWHTQRPEWYLEKKAPIEGPDYTTIPYNKWAAYKNSQQYIKYKNPNINDNYIASNTTMQEGGLAQEGLYKKADYRGLFNMPKQRNMINTNDFSQYKIPNIDLSYKNPQNEADASIYKTGDANLDGVVDEQDTPDNSNTYYDYTIANPYGEMGVDESLSYAGEQFGKGNTGMGIAGLGKTLFSGARNFLSGYAAGDSQEMLKKDYNNTLYNRSPKTRGFLQGGLINYLKEGGNVTNADLATGHYQTDEENANTEVEEGEHLQNAETGEIKEAAGEKHINGGVKVNLPNESKVISDYTKIGSNNAKQFSDNFGIKVGATNTFADVIDKVNKKIGLTDLIKKETDLLLKIEKQSKKQIDKATETINDKFLASELKAIEDEKKTLSDVQKVVFDEVFKEQEKIPKKGDGHTLLKQEGGAINEDVNNLAQKYNLSAEDMYQKISAQENNDRKQIIINEYSQKHNQSVEDIMAMLGEMQPDQQKEVIDQMAEETNQMPTYEGGGVTTDPPSKYYNKSKYNKANVGNQPYRLNSKHIAGDIATDEELQNRINAQKALLPNTTSIFQSKNLSPKEVGDFQAKYDRYNKAVILATNSNPHLTEEEKKAVLSDAEENSFSGKGSKGFDLKYGDFTSGLGAFNLPFFTKDDRTNYPTVSRIGDLIDVKTGTIKPEFAKLDANTKNQIESTYKTSGADILDLGVSDITMPNAGANIVADSANTGVVNTGAASNKNAGVRTENIGLIPNVYSNSLIPPSSTISPMLQQVTLPTQEYLKGSVESGYAANSNAANVAYENTRGLSPEMRAAAMGSILASTQEANNKLFGAQASQDYAARAAADSYNNEQLSKQTITNEGAKKQYEKENLITMNNNERDWRDYYAAMDANRKAKFDEVDRRNILNEGLNNFHVNGSNIDTNGNPLNFTGGMSEEDRKLAKLLQSMTAKQKADLQAQLTT
jgi:hypothetical protein